MKVDVLVLGAGIAGLSAAYHLQKSGLKTLVIEQAKTVGGRVQSTRVGDAEIDSGALFLTNSYQTTFQLVKELGLDSAVVRIHTRNGIIARGRIFTLPPHSFLDIARLLPLASLFHMAWMLLKTAPHFNELTLEDVLKSAGLDTASVADFALKDGDAALLKDVFDPILQGIWYWEPTTTTQVALYLLLKQALTMQLFTLKDGMGQLTGALARSLDIQLETRAIRSTYDPAAKRWTTLVRDRDGERAIESGGVLCALPATAVNDLFVDLPEDLRQFFGSIRYNGILSTHLLLNQKTNIPQFYGLYYPAAADGTKPIAAVAVQSNRFPGQGLPDRSAVSIYSSAAFSRGLFDKPDEEIKRIILHTLGSSYPFSSQDLPGSILQSMIIRIDPALPVFNVGYIKKLAQYYGTLIHHLPPGAAFAGDYMGGPHIEGAVIAAQQAAARLSLALRDMERTH
jgi:protoporphyrinogen/coproporphyrinogen III oxidase